MTTLSLRRRLAALLVRLARRVYPESPEVKAFWMDVVTDAVISGRGVVRIDPSKMYATDGADKID